MSIRWTSTIPTKSVTSVKHSNKRHQRYLGKWNLEIHQITQCSLSKDEEPQMKFWNFFAFVVRLKNESIQSYRDFRTSVKYWRYEMKTSSSREQNFKADILQTFIRNVWVLCGLILATEAVRQTEISGKYLPPKPITSIAKKIFSPWRMVLVGTEIR